LTCISNSKHPDGDAKNSFHATGMQMVGSTFSTPSYRYGFNGKENDNEIKGDGNQQDYGMRIYDPRVGRFLSVDPIQKKFPELTPYQFASNSPVGAIDLDGLEV
jgi:RHS repeat-associated protein